MKNISRKMTIKKRIFSCFIACSIMTATFLSERMSLDTYATSIDDDDEGIDVDADNSGRKTEVTAKIYESYDANYEMYEESMNDVFFFYSNVGNGSFTSEPVVLDFPNNITYVVEKDGTEVPYTNRSEITTDGNYVVRLSADYNGTKYVATFRFALRLDENANNGDNTENNVSPDDLELDPNDDISDEDIDKLIEESGAKIDTSSTDNMVNGVTIDPYCGIAQKFEPARKLYSFSLQSGEVIISNVPMGAIVNNSVSLTIPENIVPTIYKDGEPLVDQTTLNFTAPGFYKVQFYSETTNFFRFYPDEKKYPFVTFRIVGEASNDIEVFTAPKGCKIVGISTEYGPYRDAEGNRDLNLDSFWLDEEELYEFRIYDPDANGTYNVSIRRDITPPKGHMSLNKSKADLYFDSSDISYVEVYRNGVQQQYTGNHFDGKGEYIVNVYDYAGNKTVITFTLKDAFNQGTFFTILILIVLILGGFIYLRLKKTFVTVR